MNIAPDRKFSGPSLLSISIGTLPADGKGMNTTGLSLPTTGTKTGFAAQMSALNGADVSTRTPFALIDVNTDTKMAVKTEGTTANKTAPLIALATEVDADKVAVPTKPIIDTPQESGDSEPSLLALFTAIDNQGREPRPMPTARAVVSPMAPQASDIDTDAEAELMASEPVGDRAPERISGNSNPARMQTTEANELRRAAPTIGVKVETPIARNIEINPKPASGQDSAVPVLASVPVTIAKSETSQAEAKTTLAGPQRFAEAARVLSPIEDAEAEAGIVKSAERESMVDGKPVIDDASPEIANRASPTHGPDSSYYGNAQVSPPANRSTAKPDATSNDPITVKSDGKASIAPSLAPIKPVASPQSGATATQPPIAEKAEPAAVSASVKQPIPARTAPSVPEEAAQTSAEPMLRSAENNRSQDNQRNAPQSATNVKTPPVIAPKTESPSPIASPQDARIDLQNTAQNTAQTTTRNTTAPIPARVAAPIEAAAPAIANMVAPALPKSTVQSGGKSSRVPGQTQPVLTPSGLTNAIESSVKTAPDIAQEDAFSQTGQEGKPAQRLDPSAPVQTAPQSDFITANLRSVAPVANSETIAHLQPVATTPIAQVLSTSQTAAPIATSPHPVMYDAGFIDRIGQEIAMLAKGTAAVRLQIMPANMGRIDIEMHSDNNTDRVRLITESENVRQTIAQSQGRLEQELRQSGNRPAEVAVELRQNTNNQQQGSNGFGQNANNQPAGQNGNGSGTASHNQMTPPEDIETATHAVPHPNTDDSNTRYA